MILKRRCFEKGYEKSKFYSIMGNFFAEQAYRKEMPYLVNTEEKSWALFYDDKKLVGFYGYEENADVTIISGVYVIEQYRNRNVGRLMVKDFSTRFSACKITTNSGNLIRLLKERGFFEVGKRGSYATMQRRA